MDRQALIPVRALAMVLALWALLQSVLIARVLWLSAAPISQTIAGALLAAVSVTFFWGLWYGLLAMLPRRWGRWVTLVAVSVYLLLWAYHWLRLEPLTFLLLVKNSGNALTFEAVGFLFSSVSAADYLWLGLLVAGFFYAQRRHRLFTAPLSLAVPKRSVGILLVGYLLVNLPFSSSRNEYAEFAGSVLLYLQPHAAFASGETPYPYLTPAGNSNRGSDGARPHVFIVMLESFSAEYIDAQENGREVTPFINQLKKQSLYVDEFYSASVETSKGQFATLCSVFPSYKTNIFTSYPNNNFRCLSQILAEQGYTNVFMKAFHTLDFENTGEFVSNNDFAYAHGMDDNFVTPRERQKYKFGWGIQDDIFYQKTFAYLDQLQRERSESGPFFVMTMSVTNHMMFDDIPEEQRYIYPLANSHKQNYANSMYLTDQYLKAFFTELDKRDYLQDSMVVVLGDNGFPMGQHGNYHNTKTHYNELFKTPLLVWWPQHLQPQAITDQARSQLDVAPTIVDLLSIDTEHHFLGRTLRQPVDDEYFVPLVQPFDGSHLASIRYPYKYVRQIKTGQTYLYNLADDPRESINLWGAQPPIASAQVERFEQDIAALQRNEQLLKEDRIYPASDADRLRVEIGAKRLREHQPLPFRVLGELDERYRIALKVQPYAYTSAGIRELDNVISDFSASEVPADYLMPGVNRVSFSVYRDGKLRSHVARDVYVESEQAQLLTELPIAGSQEWGELNINRSVRGGPLRIGGKVYGFGLGTHAASNHTVPLRQEYITLTVGFGLDDESTCGSGAVFTIYANERALYRSKRLRNGEYGSAEVDVSNLFSVRLSTDSAGDRACDHANWINPVLLRAQPALGSAARLP
ncbi:sulfatase-like hydrolase/transferase [Gilvimarinus xylanilyticus]|uniref:Sulfatase-like hydrolase/transferase n=1 Tax=Gilvimarinus xylanilyticus TaxID=2944139 RepID=A0A9X2I5X6_9GAMM|nr:sulfatase-like hydrolase/transferase [Gilvimarinus xylanilyticus]MCP8900920.1 sulfatase-like hydrolase/transferase [Gilvimarinus xylanilyticus]